MNAGHLHANVHVASSTRHVLYVQSKMGDNVLNLSSSHRCVGVNTKTAISGLAILIIPRKRHYFEAKK
jgi:hypothetical protein